MQKKLLIIAGPTAVGKTSYAVRLARELGTEIVSCDSRQFYRELRIGVARPTDEELSAARHHFIACRSVTEPCNIFDYRTEALPVINRLFETHDTVLAVGGSGLYIDALLHPVLPMPDPTPDVRAYLQWLSLEEKQAKLLQVDPDYYKVVDLCNPVRLQRALEVYMMTGIPYSQLLRENKNQNTENDDWTVEVRVLGMDRAELRERIDRRVDRMMQEGLLDEVRSLLPYRHLNTLNTVGYRELFPVLDGTATVEDAVAAIKLNTWHYARKQMTWMRRYVAE